MPDDACPGPIGNVVTMVRWSRGWISGTTRGLRRTESHRAAPGRPMRAAAVAAVGMALVAVLGSGCVPKDLRDPIEVGGAQDVVNDPPVFPETGQVPPELLVEGLSYDFSSNEVDMDLWVPEPAEARCAAESIVDAFAVPLSDLGYEPGVDGAGINDIALSADQRSAIADLFLSCVDAEQMLGSLFMGSDHMAPSEASCMARGLAGTELAKALVVSWMSGAGFDPIGEDGANASLMLEYSNVCLPATAFLWNGLQLPGADPERSDSLTEQRTEGDSGEADGSGEDRPTGDGGS